MGFLFLYHYFIAFSLLVGLLTYRKNSPVYLKLLLPFLLVTLAVECYTAYLSSLDKDNVSIYNFFSAFEFGFYLYLISLIIQNTKVKKMIWISIAVYYTSAAANIFFIQGINTFHTTSYSAGCLLVVAFCIYYFYELFRIPGRGKLIFNPAFWICTALLFFYICGFPLYGLINVWSKEILKLVISSFELIVSMLNIFLYSLFTIAFLCSRSRKYISS